MNFIIRRLTTAFISIFGVITLVFLLMRILPGDPALIILGEQARPTELKKMRHELGLDRPLSEQYLTFLKNVIRAELGRSFYYREKVSNLIIKHLKVTVILAVLSLLVSVVFSFLGGGLAVFFRNTFFDRLIISLSQIGIAIPNFWLGPILIILFAVKIPLFPVSGYYGWESFVLPSLTLGISLSSFLTRIVRSALVDVVEASYVRYAKGKGVSAYRLMLHILRNSMIPVITVIGLQTGALLAGAVITEKVFSLPGVGTLLVYGIEMRDYPIVQGCVLTISISYVVINLIGDVLYAAIDPRVELR